MFRRAGCRPLPSALALFPRRSAQPEKARSIGLSVESFNCYLALESLAMNLPSQREVKIAIRDSLRHGDLAELANLRHIGESAISQSYNPNLETPCGIYQGLKQLSEISAVNTGALRTVWAYLSEIVEPDLVADVMAYSECPDELLGNATSEFADVVKARLANKPIHEQRVEVLEAIEVLSRLLKNLGPVGVHA